MAPRIRCLYDDCAFIAEKHCSAPSIELDPEDGCLTYTEDASSVAFLIDANEDFSDDDWEDAGYEEVDESGLDEDY